MPAAFFFVSTYTIPPTLLGHLQRHEPTPLCGLRPDQSGLQTLPYRLPTTRFPYSDKYVHMISGLSSAILFRLWRSPGSMAEVTPR